MYKILTTLVQKSDEADQGRLAACLGEECPNRRACQMSLQIASAGIGVEPPYCPIQIEMLYFLWTALTDLPDLEPP